MSQNGVVKTGFEGLQYSQSVSQGSVAIRDQFSKRQPNFHGALTGGTGNLSMPGRSPQGGSTCRTRRKVTSNC
jgi:hypothetical protein